MNHEADPTFADHLEWQIRTALRRRERFAEPVRAPGLRGLRIAALVLVSLCVGAGGVLAAERVQDARERAAAEQRRELLLTQSRVQEELAQKRLEFAQSELARLQLLSERGVLASSELAAARREPVRVQLELDLRRLDREEVELAGREPDTSLVAPRVAGRDLQGERLELEARLTEVALQEAREQHEHAALLAERGFVGSDELEKLAHGLAMADLAVRTARGKIELRLSFLRGLKSADETQLEAMLLEADGRHDAQVLRVESLWRELKRARALAAAGHAPSPDRLAAALEQERGRLELLRIELELVVARLPRGSAEIRYLGYDGK